MGSKLRSHIADHLESCVKLGTYRIPGFHFDVHTAGPSLTLQRPAAPDNLKHTAPREKCLCLKQEVHTTWENIAHPDLVAKFKDIVKNHNDKFNQSGVPAKSRRPAVDPLETLPGALAEPLRPRDGQYPDLAALKAGALHVCS